MIYRSIEWILIVSGTVTAAGGFVASIAPQPFLRLGFAVESVDAATMFFVRHWGVLIFTIGALTVCGAYVPTLRPPVLIAAALEKFVVVALIFFGPVKRTMAMTAIAGVDGLFTILYVSYLAGL